MYRARILNSRKNVRRWQVGAVAGVAVALVGVGLGVASAAETVPTVNCPQLKALPAVPARAQAEVKRNLELLNTQIAEADNRLRTSVGQGGANFIRNAILGPLADKRFATINRIETAIGRDAPKPNLNAEGLSGCALNEEGGASAQQPTDVPGAGADNSNSGAGNSGDDGAGNSTGGNGNAGGGNAGNNGGGANNGGANNGGANNGGANNGGANNGGANNGGANNGGDAGDDNGAGGDAALPAVSCPDLTGLPAVPAQAQAEVQRNLELLNTQITEANARIASSLGQGGPNFIQNAVLGPLEDKRFATINRIETAIGRNAAKPDLDAEGLAPCVLAG